MLKHNSKLALVAVVIFSMLAMYGFTPIVRAASLESAKDTLSDSEPGATATHTIEFDMGTELSADQYVDVTFAADFDITSVDVTCPENTSSSTGADYVRCTVDVGQTLSSTTVQTITAAGVVNPNTSGSYDVTVSTHQADDTEIEGSGLKVYIIDDVTVTATVDATLTFGITGLATSTDVNGTETTGTASSTSIAFGSLEAGTPTILGQELSVTTNASDGYTVTVQQDQELTSAAGANINSFDNSPDSTGSSSPHAWDSPSAQLDQTHTYGHMGFTSEDSTLSSGDIFGNNLYRGFDATSPVEVMYHDGPSDGTTDGAGLTQVAYQVEISALQEAGDYQSSLTYICTPTY
jgi:hypothetical protein